MLVVVQKKGFVIFFSPCFFVLIKLSKNVVLTHACVMCFEKKNRKLAPFFNLYKERKKNAQKKKS